MSISSQFHDKIEPMLESLERIAERLRQPPSISVEVEKIREQITENKVVSADLEKLQPSYDTLKQRGEEMIARSAGADKDISAKGNVYCFPCTYHCGKCLLALLVLEMFGKTVQHMTVATHYYRSTHCLLSSAVIEVYGLDGYLGRYISCQSKAAEVLTLAK